MQLAVPPWPKAKEKAVVTGVLGYFLPHTAILSLGPCRTAFG